MGSPTDGIILIDKEGGRTSYGVVKELKASLGGAKKRKVGHAGTLDPFATGLLVILVDQGTKLSPFIMSGDKVYEATLRLGVETDTLDPTGRVVRSRPVAPLEPEHIQGKAQQFVGTIDQVPPVFSAVKSGGIPAYKLARKGVKVDPKRRRVKVYSLRILSIDLPHVTMEVACSGGTYIRSLAADLGTELGPGAHLRSLRRLASGPFRVEEALSSRDIPPSGGSDSLRKRIIPLRDALPDMDQIEVDKFLAKKIRQGYQPEWQELPPGSRRRLCQGGYSKVVENGELVAVVGGEKMGGNDQTRVILKRVFS